MMAGPGLLRKRFLIIEEAQETEKLQSEPKFPRRMNKAQKGKEKQPKRKSLK